MLTTASVISFSLTLLAASLAVLLGFVPLRQISHFDRLTVGELLFLMPVVALVLGVVFEASRIAFSRQELPEPRQRQQIRWSPGRREG
jgi:hypothetical protein